MASASFPPIIKSSVSWKLEGSIATRSFALVSTGVPVPLPGVDKVAKKYSFPFGLSSMPSLSMSLRSSLSLALMRSTNSCLNPVLYLFHGLGVADEDPATVIIESTTG